MDAADEQAQNRLEATVVAIERRFDVTEESILGRFDDAESSLESSQKALADTASGVYGLTSEFKDIARDMKDTAIALRALNPEKIEARLTGLSGDVEKLGPAVDDLRGWQRRAQTLLLVLVALVVIVGIVSAVK